MQAYWTNIDKGDEIAVFNREKHISEMDEVLNDPIELKKMQNNKTKLTIRLEDRVNMRWGSLYVGRGFIYEDFYSSNFTSGSQQGSMYGLPKVH